MDKKHTIKVAKEKFKYWIFCLLLIIYSCTQKVENEYELMVLGVAQDGGYPQAGCEKSCCTKALNHSGFSRNVTCLSLYDRKNNKVYFFEATPDYNRQWHLWKQKHPGYNGNYPDGFFITHAHIGHYTGLMQLGREVMGTAGVPVYVLPRMAEFLNTNGPWSQLVKLNNIKLYTLTVDSTVDLNGIKVKSFLVPHRDEYSETAGFEIVAGIQRILFIPDIDKWDKWNKSLLEEIQKSTLVFVDATFYKNGELGRDMSEIPHPFVTETMELLQKLNKEEKNKVHFIHFNHTNPILWDAEYEQQVHAKGFSVAKQEHLVTW